MSNHAHDYDMTMALLKSIAQPCDREDEHAWRRCRHCLAVNELSLSSVRARLKAFIDAVEVVDAGYGHGV